VWEKLGKEKRHLLKDNVEKARTEQEKASEEFKDVLTRVKEVYGFQGGELEDYYNRLKDDYDACESRAQKVDKRIEQVEDVASDLFNEWETEIEQISKPEFRTQSRRALADAKRRYSRLEKAMERAQSRMEPVLVHLKDYVLYLKHNLNAQAVGALQKEVNSIEIEVDGLIQDISKSIREADDFLKNFS
jgi:chromosome segregation ATPase